MKKSILIFAITLISTLSFSQKIGIKLTSKQDVIYAPALDAQTVKTDTIGVVELRDDGISLSCVVSIGTKLRALKLWEGQSYIDNQNWTNQMVLSRIKFLLNIK